MKRTPPLYTESMVLDTVYGKTKVFSSFPMEMGILIGTVSGIGAFLSGAHMGYRLGQNKKVPLPYLSGQFRMKCIRYWMDRKAMICIHGWIFGIIDCRCARKVSRSRAIL